jgi:hypothetical protein
VRHVSLQVRREFVEHMLSHEAVLEFPVWTNTLCIALFPPATIVTAWRNHGIKGRSKKYRSTITTFLEEYQDDGIHNKESFIYVLHTFYTLTDLLRRDVDERDYEAAYAEADRDSQDHSNVQGEEIVDVNAAEHTSETSGRPDSSRVNADGGTSPNEDEDDDESEPETEETRMRDLEEKTKKEAGQAVSR